MQRTLYIHIGSHKTGTTSIQEFLYSNRNLLNQNGYHYHCTEMRNFHPFIDVVPVARHFASATITNDAECFLNECPKDKNVIISSENFSFIYDEDVIKNFIEKCRNIFSNVKIVSYIRRQDSHLISHHQEAAKPYRLPESALWGGDVDIFPIYRERHRNYLDYNFRLVMWAKFVGQSNLIIRIFDKDHLIKSDSVHDFLNVLGITIDEKIDFFNTSIGTKKALIGHMIRRYTEDENVHRIIFNKIFDDGDKFEVPLRKRIKYLSNFYESNGRLFSYFGLPVIEEWCAPPLKIFPQSDPNEVQNYLESSGFRSIESLVQSLAKFLHVFRPDQLRDIGIHLRSLDNELAYQTLLAARELRPNGPIINRHIQELESLLYCTK